jgi:isopenicillin-N N-acyltransferase-like protein
MAALPQIVVAGGPFARGEQYGTQAGDLIRLHVDLLVAALCEQAGLAVRHGKERLLARALAFLPLYEDYAPDLVEELRGVAAGAALAFPEVLLLNVRAEALGLPEGGCTSCAIGRSLTADGAILAGQTMDQRPWNREVLMVLTVRPEHGTAMLMCAHAGLIGYHGCNSAGVAQFANDVPPVGWRMAMPQYLLKRRLLEQVDVAGCLGVLRRTPIASAGNYVLADRGGHLLDVELNCDDAATIETQDDLIVHANHYQHPRLVRHNADFAHLAGSCARAERLATLIRAQAGRLTLGALQAALTDRASVPEQINSLTSPYGMTVAALIAEPDQGRLHVAPGGPEPLEWSTYRVP